MSMPIFEISRELPNAFHSGVKTIKDYDITDDVLRRAFPDKPSEMTKLIHLCVVGKPGSGKTVLLKFLAKKALEKYGEDDVHILVTDNLRIAIENLDDRPIQLLFIDDAMQYASSRNIHKQSDLAGEFQLLRHLAEDKKKPMTPGIVLCVFSWQRWIDLDPAFRESSITIWKSGASSDKEEALMERTIGSYYTRKLIENSNWVELGHEDLKSYSVGYLANLRGTNKAAGIFRSQYVKYLPQWPEPLRTVDYFKNKEKKLTKEEKLELMRSSEEWKDALACYDLIEKHGLSVRKAASKLEMNFSRVYRLYSKITKELSEAA